MKKRKTRYIHNLIFPVILFHFVVLHENYHTKIFIRQRQYLDTSDIFAYGK